MLSQHVFADLVEFFDNWIFSHSHGSMSSDGVQINGGSKPESRHTAYTCGRMFPFTMCLQFQLSK
jgi:hypothetical protein